LVYVIKIFTSRAERRTNPKKVEPSSEVQGLKIIWP
jgi:hypothetical protein